MTPRSESFENTGREAEETLRLVAQLPPPEDLSDRVHRRLDAERMVQAEERRTVWSLWMPSRKLQFAGAALLAAAVAASTWSVHHGRMPNGDASQGHSRDGQPQAGAQSVPVVPRAPQTGGFTPAGAVAAPRTLAPIKVAPAPKKKPGKAAAKPAPGKLAPSAAVAKPE